MEKIINSFSYVDDDEMVCVSLFTERMKRVPVELFKEFIQKYKINENHICLCFSEGDKITPIYKFPTPDAKKVKDLPFEVLIKVVYDRCIELTSTRLHQ